MSAIYPKKLVVLGAGFSCPMGIPAMNGMLCRFKAMNWPDTYDWNIHGISIPEQKAKYETLVDWEGVSADVEEYGEYLLNMKGARSFELKRFSSVFVRGLQIPIEGEKTELHKRLWTDVYLAFAKEIGGRADIEVCTFNYDLVLDQALLVSGFYPEYHLGKEDVIHVHESNRVGTRTSLLKPNGSINWLVCDLPFDTCNKVTVKWDLPDTTKSLPGNWGTGPERHTGHGRCPNLESDLHFLMLPPGMKQRPTEWAALKSIKRVHDRLFDVSRNAEEIYFVGWSAPETDWDWARQFWGHTRAKVHVVSKTGSRVLKDRYCRLVDRRGGGIKWHFGPVDGDMNKYLKSKWRKLLLKTR